MTAFRRPAQDPSPTPEMFRRVKAIVSAALDCDETERDRHLDEACAGDEALRLEVESLLDATLKAEKHFEMPDGALSAGNLGALEIGAGIGPYRDLVRVALRRQFFVLVARFGTKEKVPLDTFKNYQSFEQMRDSLIEDQLHSRYLKDLILFLDREGVTQLPPDKDERLVAVVEVILRRNVHVHNGGRIDRTYLDKADASFNPFGFTLGDYAPIDDPYWQAANAISARWVNKIGTWVDGLPTTTT